jgi:hypothetical protein
MIVLIRLGELAVQSLGNGGPKVESRAAIFGGKSYVEPVLGVAGSIAAIMRASGSVWTRVVRKPATELVTFR